MFGIDAFGNVVSFDARRDAMNRAEESGDRRGGIFEIPCEPKYYHAAPSSSVPAVNPLLPGVGVPVPTDASPARPIPFAPTQVRKVTGPNPVAGLGRTAYTSYDKGHRHSVQLDGMGNVIPVGYPPRAVLAPYPVRVPSQHVEGGIFGRGHVRAMATGPDLSQVRTITNRPVAGFGAGPDGLG